MLRPAAWGGAAETAPRTKPSLARGQEGGSKSGVVLMMLGHHLGVVERIRTLGRAFPPEARPGEIEQGGGPSRRHGPGARVTLQIRPRLG